MRIPILKTLHRHGFTLVSTLSMLMILTVVAVGFLTLSSIALRTSSLAEARVRAQANARMALMIAIGELQRELGPDQRISANGEILRPDPSMIRHRHWTGVWDSWKAGEGESSQHSTIVDVSDDMVPSYLPNRSDRFRKWLVSLDPAESQSINSPLSLALEAVKMPDAVDDAILLVSDNSLGQDSADPADYVAARLIQIQNETTSEVTGRYGWWIGDESQKARIMDDSYNIGESLTLVDRLYRSQAAPSTGTAVVQGLTKMANDMELETIPSMRTLDLVTGAEGRPSQLNFHHVTPYSYQVLADVREGGLKRDLSTLLERPVYEEEYGDEFMLYRFDDKGEARVPIQDLAAYYQLYFNDPAWSKGRRQGIEANSSSGSFQIRQPDYGNPSKREKHLRQYGSIYSSPVPIRIQYVLAMVGAPLTQSDKDQIAKYEAKLAQQYKWPTVEWARIKPTPTHKLMIGVIPILTLWNPNNVPLVIAKGNRQIFKMTVPPFGFGLTKYRADGLSTIENAYNNLSNLLSSMDYAGGNANERAPYIMQFKFGESGDVRFEPGEVKIFSYPSGAASILKDGQALKALDSSKIYEPINAWDPYGFLLSYNSSGVSSNDWQWPLGHSFRLVLPNGDSPAFMVFSATDSFATRLVVECGDSTGGKNPQEMPLISSMNEVVGAGFNFWMADMDHVQSNQTFHFRNYQALSRFGGASGVSGRGKKNYPFNRSLMQQGFPDLKRKIPAESRTNAIKGAELIAAGELGEAKAFLVFSLMAGCEVSSSNTAGYAAGRRMATRPFIHGSTIAAPLIDSYDPISRYDSGWDWQVDRINSVEEAIQMQPGTGNAFFGGGYTIGAGTTSVVQPHLPVLPPISIAALSSAHLGGYSLADQPVVGRKDENVGFVQFGITTNTVRGARGIGAFETVTATGAVGLAPHTMQAIGNSYAHPNIPAEKAFTTYYRLMNIDAVNVQDIPYVDHSYLANKALWDEFFFSSMVAQPATDVPIFENNRSLDEVAQEFFFESKPLPNRRIVPYGNGLDYERLGNLVGTADQYEDGFADKIAGHLMVEGAFNVNSTSVEAWKVFLSSLKGKPVAYIDEDNIVAEHVSEGVSVNAGMIGVGIPVKTEQIQGINTPQEQWKAARELSDAEISELATAIVKQVKLRGPFLSLSDFVNRRLEKNSPLALKGALQAALDDPDVSINAAFRASDRKLDTETTGIPFAYPEAAKGPIAYGSNAYVDQADILGQFAEQLAPRGDTFIIRTYGDALDKDGNVQARAWCEAVVQRLPEYVNPKDEPSLKQSDPLLSEASKSFGRKIRIVQFRWLDANEV